MARHRLTDDQWELIAGIFPPPARTGRPRVDGWWHSVDHEDRGALA